MGDEANSTTASRDAPPGERLKDLTICFLAERHHLLAFIQGLVRERDAAEEILQEVWLRCPPAGRRPAPPPAPARYHRPV